MVAYRKSMNSPGETYRHVATFISSKRGYREKCLQDGY